MTNFRMDSVRIPQTPAFLPICGFIIARGNRFVFIIFSDEIVYFSLVSEARIPGEGAACKILAGLRGLLDRLCRFPLLFYFDCCIITAMPIYGCGSTHSFYAGVMELADVVDSKSTGGDTVPVRVRPPAPSEQRSKFGTQKMRHPNFDLCFYTVIPVFKPFFEVCLLL